MATQEYSSDFVGPIMPASYGSDFVGPPAPPSSQTYTHFQWSPPSQPSFPAAFITPEQQQERNWAREVLQPTLTSVKSTVSPPPKFEPTTMLSDTSRKQISQATSWAGNHIFSSANDRISQDATVLDFLNASQLLFKFK